jgi:hypothetical protein
MIVANGCSFTEGYYLDNTESAWPDQLGKLINHSVVNLSQGGGSNQRIFRTTIDYLTTNTPEYLIIGWTDISRFEFPIINGTYARITNTDVLFQEPLVSNPDQQQIHQFYYKNLFNPYLNTIDLLNYIITIQELCYAKNIKHLFFHAFTIPRFDSILKDYHEYYRYEEHQLDDKLSVAKSNLESKISKINQKFFWNWNSTMMDWCKFQKFEFEPSGHPTEQGHLEFAKELSSMIDY